MNNIDFNEILKKLSSMEKSELEANLKKAQEILQKLYQATENTMKLYESAEYDSKNNLEKNINHLAQIQVFVLTLDYLLLLFHQFQFYQNLF